MYTNPEYDSLSQEQKEAQCELINWKDLTAEVKEQERKLYEGRHVKIHLTISEQSGNEFEVIIKQGKSVVDLKKGIAKHLGYASYNLRLHSIYIIYNLILFNLP